MKLLKQLVHYLKPEPKKLVKFAGRWIDSKIPTPTSCTFFFGHISLSDIQILLGTSNFLTDEINPSFLASLSPQKAKEFQVFLSSVIKTYEDKFGIIEIPPTSVPPTTIH